MALHDSTSTIFFTWGNRSLLADLYALSRHEPVKHGERGIYHQLITGFISPDRSQNVSIHNFLQ